MRGCWWALVALTVVFAMHGLQCVSHDLEAHAGHGAAATLVTLPLPATHAVESPPAPDAAAVFDVPEHSDQVIPGDPPSPLPSGLWMACLAVLAAVVVLVAAVLLRGPPVARDRTGWASFVRSVSSPALPRPPGLFLLCVLRN